MYLVVPIGIMIVELLELLYLGEEVFLQED